jgi:hypothetical protein
VATKDSSTTLGSAETPEYSSELEILLEKLPYSVVLLKSAKKCTF